MCQGDFSTYASRCSINLLLRLQHGCCAAVLLQVTTGESRARMGEVAHQRSDFVILTDTDPGLEDPKAILQVRPAARHAAAKVPRMPALLVPPATRVCWDCPCS